VRLIETRTISTIKATLREVASRAQMKLTAQREPNAAMSRLFFIFDSSESDESRLIACIAIFKILAINILGIN
jgi:hypothetical protein